jgi:hypothetical protein
MGYEEMDTYAAAIMAYDEWELLKDEAIGQTDPPYSVGRLYDFAMQSGNERLMGYVSRTRALIEHDPAYRGAIDSWAPVLVYDDNQDSGYYAVVFETGPDSAIVAIRGSEPEGGHLRQDWLGDTLLMGSATSPQLRQNDRLLEEMREQGLLDRYSAIRPAGHSLGGFLAIDFTLKANALGCEVEHCAAFDSPGGSWAYIIANLRGLYGARGTITKYRASFVGYLLHELPWVEVVNVEAAPPGRIGELLAYPVARHGMLLMLRKEDGSFSRSPSPPTPEMALAKAVSVAIDSTVLSIPIRLYLAEVYVAWQVLEDPALFAVKAMDSLEGVRAVNEAIAECFAEMQAAGAEQAMADAQMRAEYGEWLAAQAQAFLYYDGERRLEEGRLQGEFYAWLGSAMTAPPRPAPRLVDALGAAGSSAAAARRAQRRRDFSEGALQGAQAVLQDLLDDPPFDVTRHHLCHEFEVESRRLVPEAAGALRGMKDYNRLFDSRVRHCKDEIGRRFEAAMAVDAASAAKLGGHNEGLGKVADGMSSLTDRLGTAAARTRGIGQG